VVICLLGDLWCAEEYKRKDNQATHVVGLKWDWKCGIASQNFNFHQNQFGHKKLASHYFGHWLISEISVTETITETEIIDPTLTETMVFVKMETI